MRKERFTKKMQIDYEKYARIFKVMSDPKRLKIIDMLSEGELCACKILEEFHITQPTLSHDMKLLVDAGLVNDRREGKNIYYSLNEGKIRKLQGILDNIFTQNSDCICHRTSESKCD